MKGIGEFFKKINNAHTKEVFLRTEIKEALKKTTGIDISIENISIKNPNIVIKKATQAEKSIIFIKKQKIIEEIRQKPKDIIFR